MRGITFAPSSRADKPSANSSTTTLPLPSSSSTTLPHLHSPSPAIKMMKKLSTTFRRRGSTIPTPSTPSFPDALPPADKVAQETKRAAAAAAASAKHAHASSARPRSARAMTFSAPARTDPPARADIPFFGERAASTHGAAAAVARPPVTPAVEQVRGKPAWALPGPQQHSPHPHRPDSAPASTPTLPAPQVLRESNRSEAGSLARHAAAAPSPTSAPDGSVVTNSKGKGMVAGEVRVMSQQQAGLPPFAPRHRHHSFDVDVARARGRAVGLSVDDANGGVGRANGQGGRMMAQVEQGQAQGMMRRRWLLPLSENPEVPRLFNPTSATSFERITRHRDRTEARALTSACTFLEAEIDRLATLCMAGGVGENGGEGMDGCCSCEQRQDGKGMITKQNGGDDENGMETKYDEKKKSGVNGNAKTGCCANCRAGMMLPGTVRRLTAVLGVLEERYDSIEQVYVKGEEYARAMGRFFQVNPERFSKILADDGTTQPPALNAQARRQNAKAAS